MRPENKQILGPDGVPIGDHNDQSTLPLQIQALIESRVNTAMDAARENLRREIDSSMKSRNTRALIRYTLVGIVNIIAALLLWLYGPNEVKNWTRDFVADNMNKPTLESAAQEVVADKMAKYVSDRMVPLNQKANELKSSIDEVNRTVAEKQTILEDRQKKLSGQLHIQDLAIFAKAGSREAYTALLDMRSKEVDANDLLTASLKEIELLYDVDRNQLSFQVLVHKETWKDPGYAVDDVIFEMRHNPTLMEGAINTLSQLKSEASIKELCRIVNSSQNLRVAARATRAIEIITGEKIGPLEFDKVQNWWEKNKDNKAYLGDYDGYCEVAEKMGQRPNRNKLPEFISNLNKTITSDTKALHSMCLKAGFLVMIGESAQAKDLLDEVRKIKSDYYWLYVWEAALKIKEGDLDSAIKSVNSGFAKSATSDIETTLRFWNIFEPIRDNPKVAWPSKEKQDTQQSIPADAEKQDSLSGENK